MNNLGSTQKYKSHAKINLGLKVVNKRKDGYHNIDSLFVELDLHDTITFTSSSTFSLSTNFSELPVDDSNLVTKTYIHSKSNSRLRMQIYRFKTCHLEDKGHLKHLKTVEWPKIKNNVCLGASLISVI